MTVLTFRDVSKFASVNPANIDKIDRIVEILGFNSLTLGSLCNLVLLKLDTVLYSNLAYTESFTEFCSLKQILCKV